MLLGLFVAIKYLPQYYLDLTVNVYCWLLGVVANASVLSPLLSTALGAKTMEKLVIDRRGKKTPLLEVGLAAGRLLATFHNDVPFAALLCIQFI